VGHATSSGGSNEVCQYGPRILPGTHFTQPQLTDFLSVNTLRHTHCHKYPPPQLICDTPPFASNVPLHSTPRNHHSQARKKGSMINQSPVKSNCMVRLLGRYFSKLYDLYQAVRILEAPDERAMDVQVLPEA